MQSTETILKEIDMRNILLRLASAAALSSASFAAGAASAEPAPRLIFAVEQPGDSAALERVQFIFGGHNFCWYDAGWQGPGFYWCGYANRRGLGWGGGDGFHGWHGAHGPAAGHGAPPRAAADHGHDAHAAPHGDGGHGGDDKKPHA
jgi:hypothetical protein